ncbi:MAG: flagellar assembly protein FliW [Lachnospiraceae bacterium]|nr:flagellar assembly protein FliW [Lachnospiraceae bacterium]
MRIDTKIFGTIEVADEKIIRFDNGIIGFPDLKGFTLLHDEEKGTGVGIRFLQSIDEPAFAMPVMDPLLVKPDYDPEVEDELLKCIGEVNGENILVLVTATIPSDLTKMSVNLQGPIIINVDECRGCQIIVDNTKFPVKFPIYDILKKEGE